MLLKILGCVALVGGSWCLGKNISNSYSEKIKIIDSYILFLKNFKSAVVFSGTNMYSFFLKNKDDNIRNFLDFLIKKRNVKDIYRFEGINKIENKCIDLISESIILAEKSSDSELISNYFEESISKLNYYKNEIVEEYRGKIKTAPSIGAVVGMFIAVLVI